MISFFLLETLILRIQSFFYHSFFTNMMLRILLRLKLALNVWITQVVLIFFLTNNPNSFQNAMKLSTGLSDFHKVAVTVLKYTFSKSKPKEITYYKNFDQEIFKT